MSEWMSKSIGDLLQSHFPGDWGADPSEAGELTQVFRGADFVSSGKLERDGGAARKIVGSKLKKIELLPGDILLEKSGGSPDQPVGRVSYFDYATRPAAASNFLQTLRPAIGVDSKFLFYLLQNEYARGRVLPFQQQTTGIINFRLGDYLKEQVVIPAALAEQRHIADLLSAVDEQIASLDAIACKKQRLFEGMRNALLSRRKHDGLERHESTATTRDVKSGRLSDLVELVRDKCVPRDVSDDLPCINLEHVTEGSGRITGNSRVSDNLSAKTRFEAGDILFGKLRPYLRKYAQPAFPGVCTSELLVFRAKHGVDPHYAYQVVASTEFCDYCVSASFGTKMPRTDWRTASDFPILIPREAEQRRIGNLLSAVDEQVAQMRESIRKLTLLKRGLAQALLTPKNKGSQ